MNQDKKRGSFNLSVKIYDCFARLHDINVLRQLELNHLKKIKLPTYVSMTLPIWNNKFASLEHFLMNLSSLVE